MFQWFEIGIRRCRQPSLRSRPINEADPAESILPFEKNRVREGGGDIRTGYERVLQEVQNVIFDIPKSFQLIKAPSLPVNVPRPKRLLEVAPSRYISAKSWSVGQLLANTTLPALFGSNLIFAHYSKLAPPSSPAAVLPAGCWKSW